MTSKYGDSYQYGRGLAYYIAAKDAMSHEESIACRLIQIVALREMQEHRLRKFSGLHGMLSCLRSLKGTASFRLARTAPGIDDWRQMRVTGPWIRFCAVSLPSLSRRNGRVGKSVALRLTLTQRTTRRASRQAPMSFYGTGR